MIHSFYFKVNQMTSDFTWNIIQFRLKSGTDNCWEHRVSMFSAVICSTLKASLLIEQIWLRRSRCETAYPQIMIASLSCVSTDKLSSSSRMASNDRSSLSHQDCCYRNGDMCIDSVTMMSRWQFGIEMDAYRRWDNVPDRRFLQTVTALPNSKPLHS